MRSMNRSIILPLLFILLAVGTIIATYRYQIPFSVSDMIKRSSAQRWYVSPQGNDQFDGLSKKTPLKTIQRAVDRAMPGDTINLLPGIYLQDIISQRDGTKDAPITIKGTSEAIVKGGSESRIVQIHHDYLTLQGFTIDGKYRESHTQDSYRDKLIYATGTKPRDGVR